MWHFSVIATQLLFTLALWPATTFSAKPLQLSSAQAFETLKPDADARSRQAAFERVSPNDPQFKLIIEELLKATYDQKKWPEFFSYAHYYRKRWPIKELHEVYQLELLGLLRHCQNDILNTLIEGYQKESGSKPAAFTQILALSRTRFSGKQATTGKNFKLQSHADGKALWKSDKKWIGKTHPKNLRVKVENLCDDFN